MLEKLEFKNIESFDDLVDYIKKLSDFDKQMHFVKEYFIENVEYNWSHAFWIRTINGMNFSNFKSKMSNNIFDNINISFIDIYEKNVIEAFKHKYNTKNIEVKLCYIKTEDSDNNLFKNLDKIRKKFNFSNESILKYFDLSKNIIMDFIKESEIRTKVLKEFENTFDKSCVLVHRFNIYDDKKIVSIFDPSFIICYYLKHLISIYPIFEKNGLIKNNVCSGFTLFIKKY